MRVSATVAALAVVLAVSAGIVGACAPVAGFLVASDLPRALEGASWVEPSSVQVYEQVAPVEDPPNILVVLVDDLGIEHAEGWGVGEGPYAPMPTVDRLASEGVRFAHWWSMPVCSPTRATLLTGRYAMRHGVGEAVQEPEQLGLPLPETTIPEVLDDVGYTSGAFGKWHLGVDAEEGGLDAPLDQGFDRAVITEANLTPAGESFFLWTWLRDGVAEGASGYITSATVDEAIAWAGEQPGPWFAYVAFHAPHGPVHCPPDDLTPLSAPCNEGTSSTLEKYQAMAEAADTELERLLAAVEPLGELVVLWSSDNGSAGVVALPPFDSSRVKRTVFEGGVRVPAVAWGSGVSPGIVESPVGTVDLLPTAAELAGVDTAGMELDGESIVPCLSDAGCSPHSELMVGTFTPNGTGGWATAESWHRAARDERYKLLVTSDGKEGLVDLVADPYETENLLGGELTSEEQAAYDGLVAYLQGLAAEE